MPLQPIDFEILDEVFEYDAVIVVMDISRNTNGSGVELVVDNYHVVITSTSPTINLTFPSAPFNVTLDYNTLYTSVIITSENCVGASPPLIYESLRYGKDIN